MLKTLKYQGMENHPAGADLAYLLFFSGKLFGVTKKYYLIYRAWQVFGMISKSYGWEYLEK